jgi:hypothetical protein
MITLEAIPEEVHTDRLLLLVGTNPLPNYVAALLLTKPKSKIYLLHTAITSPVAQNLRRTIKKRLPGVETIFVQVDPADSAQIRQEVETTAKEFKRGESIGLNYTGGTKAMSVHAHRVLAQINRPIIFSYLDADTLTLRFDGNDGEQSRLVYASGKCPVSFNEVAQLHGYSEFKPGREEKVLTAMRQQVLQDLADIHKTQSGYTDWRDYGKTSYQTVTNLSTWNTLEPFAKTIDRFCGTAATTNDVAQALGLFDKLSSYSKWFAGEWLEEYVFQEVKKLQSELYIQEAGISLMPIAQGKINNRFELDVAAMRGYQLFAISCMVAGTAGEQAIKNYKGHLLEIFVRARQFGGDEARVALVCNFADTAQLVAHLEEAWFVEGRIRIFGCKELDNLGAHLRNWFQTANL